MARRIYSGDTDLPNRKRTVYRSPNIGIVFEMDRAGIARIAMGKELHKACRSVVIERALPFALSVSPEKSGDYKRHFRVRSTSTVIASMRRVAVKLINDSDHAGAVEFINKRGNGNGTRVLGKTLDHLNHASIVAHEAKTAARKAARGPFKADLHPRDARGRFAGRGAIVEAAKTVAAKKVTETPQRPRRRGKQQEIDVQQELRTTRQWMDVRRNMADDTGGGYDLSPLRFERQGQPPDVPTYHIDLTPSEKRRKRRKKDDS